MCLSVCLCVFCSLCSVFQLCPTLCEPMNYRLQYTKLSCPSPSPRACSNSCPLRQWFHPIILSFVIPFSSCLRSSPESGSFLMSWLSASGGQSFGALASASVLLLPEGGHFPGPKWGSCLTIRNELSEETHVLTKQEILLGKGTQVESSRVREPRRIALPCGLQSQV